MRLFNGVAISYFLFLGISFSFANESIQEQREEALQMIREGEDFRDVVETLNINPEDLYRWVYIAEVQTGIQLTSFLRDKESFTSEEIAGAVQMVRDGQSFAEAALELNTLPDNIREWFHLQEARTREQIDLQYQRQSSISSEEKPEDGQNMGTHLEEEQIGQQIAHSRRPRMKPEQKREIVRLVIEERKTFAEVARRFNTASTNVQRWVRQHEERTGQQIVPIQPKQSFAPEEKEEAVRLIIEEHKSYEEVAEKFNTWHQTVRGWVDQYEERTGQQIAPEREYFNRERKAEAVRLVIEEHKDFVEVATELGTTPRNVRRWVRQHGERTGQQIALRQHHRSFSPEEQAEAVRLVIEERKTFAEVSRELHIEGENIRRWVRQHEERTGQQIVPQIRQSFTPEEKNKAVRLVIEERKRPIEVAREVGTSVENLRKWVRQYKEKEAVRLVMEEHKRPIEVARKLGTSPQNVRKWVRESCSIILL